MVPEGMRVKRGARLGKKLPIIDSLAPTGTAWCAGCQSFRDLEDFAKGATRCRPCASAKAHSSMIEKTYGLTSEQYDALLERQGGRCAICRARPKSKRLAVDHDHKTGVVRGLLCSRCNHDLLGSAWDSLAMATALWHYMNTPPATGRWLAPEDAPQLVAATSAAQGPATATNDALAGIVARRGEDRRSGGRTAPSEGEPVECTREHFLRVGARAVMGKKGVYEVWVGEDSDPPF